MENDQDSHPLQLSVHVRFEEPSHILNEYECEVLPATHAFDTDA